MSNQTSTPTSVMDRAPETDARDERSPRAGRAATWLALGAGVLAFVVVLLAILALRDGGGADDDEGPAARRLAGADRYETAVAISARAFPEAAPVVYLIPEDVTPDALAASSLRDGPVLVVPPCGDLPEVVSAEIRRLGPDEVVALGGESAVCDDIVRQAVGR